jgi:DNA-binding Lrp family transcriptional regulator
MKAYVLINIRTGSIRDVVRHLQTVPGIIEANMTLGPYDAVAIVDAKDINHLGDLLATKIQPIPGVLETMTCMSVGA